VCHGLDYDCDGQVDEEGGAITWYPDADGDGYGDEAGATSACEAPDGAIATAGDCDDADAAVNPGAIEECTDTEDLNCDGSIGYADADGDGWAACEECDDSEATVHPEAGELCNGVDDDCDGEIDEEAADALTFYEDLDGDGFGDDGATTTACEAPEGYAAVGGDCDDTSAATNSAADETCNGLDDDCDGSTDEAGADGETTWYADTDGDGYGDDAATTAACEQPAGYVSVGGDCDDADAGYNPGASEACDDPADYNCDGSVGYADADGDGWAACEECDDASASNYPGATESCDGTDNDCDGTVDEADAVDAATWYADDDGDTWGDATDSTTACDAPAGYVADATDCDDTAAGVNPGEVELCNGIDDDCDGDVDEADAGDVSTWYADADGDGHGDASATTASCSAPSGYVATGDDCDDADAAVSPGATETCNGIDDDCDSSVDEDEAADVLTWYLDADGDGFGDASAADTDCDQPSGYVADDTDCDDTDGAVNPAAAEVCDGVDNDCAGGVDEGFDADGDGTADCYDTEVCDGVDNDGDGAVDEAGSTGESTWYADADGDGYGDPATTATACEAPAGYVADATDCDDGDGAVNPGASEVCNGLDDDCDGITDTGAVDADTWYADGDGDGYGTSSTTATSCSAPAGYVASSGDCNDAAASINPGATESCNSVDDDCDGSTDESGATGETTWYADADGDGYGSAATSAKACSAPSGYVADATDCDDADDTTNPGEIDQCDNDDEDCDGYADDDGYCPCDVAYYGTTNYLFCESAKDWSTAQSYCEAYTYTMLAMNDAGENEFAWDEASSRYNGKWWTGGNDQATEGTWVWENGDSFSYTNWHSGEPNNTGTGGEDCLQLGRFGDDTWNDEPCSSSFYFVCEGG
jgi:hypothetical protein